MLKVIYDFIPYLVEKDEYFFFLDKGYKSIGLVFENNNDDSIVIAFEFLVKFFNLQMIVRIRDDDRIIKKCFQMLKTDIKKMYPMKSAGFLYFLPAELHAQLFEYTDIEAILKNFGHYQGFDLFFITNDNIPQINQYLQKDLYKTNNTNLLPFLHFFNAIISQSGDENELEIVFKKEYFDNLQKGITLLSN